MPTEIHGTLYSITDLADLIKMVKDFYGMKPDTSKTTTLTSTTPFCTMQSKITTQPSFNLASALFLNSPVMTFIHFMTTVGSITKDLDPINHTLPEAEVGVAIPMTIRARFIEVLIDIKVEVDFIQDPEMVEDHF